MRSLEKEHLNEGKTDEAKNREEHRAKNQFRYKEQQRGRYEKRGQLINETEANNYLALEATKLIMDIFMSRMK